MLRKHVRGARVPGSLQSPWDMSDLVSYAVEKATSWSTYLRDNVWTVKAQEDATKRTLVLLVPGLDGRGSNDLTVLHVNCHAKRLI